MFKKNIHKYTYYKQRILKLHKQRRCTTWMITFTALAILKKDTDFTVQRKNDDFAFIFWNFILSRSTWIGKITKQLRQTQSIHLAKDVIRLSTLSHYWKSSYVIQSTYMKVKLKTLRHRTPWRRIRQFL